MPDTHSGSRIDSCENLKDLPSDMRMTALPLPAKRIPSELLIVGLPSLSRLGNTVRSKKTMETN